MDRSLSGVHWHYTRVTPQARFPSNLLGSVFNGVPQFRPNRPSVLEVSCPESLHVFIQIHRSSIRFSITAAAPVFEASLPRSNLTSIGIIPASLQNNVSSGH